MTFYTVQAPPASAGVSDPARFLFVKEGFCWPGLIVPLIWLLYRRLWIVAGLFVLAMVGASLLGADERLSLAGSAVALLAFLLVGFEGNDLRRWTLGLRGYRMVGVVEGASAAEAEIRFFAGWSAGRSPTPPPAAYPAPSVMPADVVGLFPTAESTR